MRADALAYALHKRREELQAEVFAAPPLNYEDFAKRLGVWMGLGEALSIIEDARKSEENDD